MLSIIITVFQSCCDCDEDNEDTLYFKFNTSGGKNSFNISDLDSAYKISCEKNNINNHIDTVFICIFENKYSFAILAGSFYNDAEDYDYIIKNDSPYFEHTITDIIIEGKYTLPPCRCYRNTRKDFKFDGIQKTKKDLPYYINKD